MAGRPRSARVQVDRAAGVVRSAQRRARGEVGHMALVGNDQEGKLDKILGKPCPSKPPKGK